MDYAAFVRRQQDVLLREFVDNPGHCFIGIPSLSAFESRYFGSGSIRVLPGAALSEAFVWTRGPGSEELWVRPVDKSTSTNGKYRGHWEAFVRTLDAGEVTYRLGGQSQVIDHLLPETFAARQGYSHVRVVMIEKRGNSTVGSVVEKHMAQREDPGKSMLADWFTAAKASCFRGSFAKSVSNEQVMSDLRKHLTTRGFTLTEQESEVSPTCMEAILTWVRAG